MRQEKVRKMFIKENPGVRLKGRKGYWYRCAYCGKWCGRAGGEKANIPDDEQMEVDHIIPWSMAYDGANQLANLQALCRPCNRAKTDKPSNAELEKAFRDISRDGDFTRLLVGMWVSDVSHKLGVPKKRK